MNIKNIGMILLLLLTLSACNKTELIQSTATCIPTTEFVVNTSHPKGAKIQAVMDKYVAKGIPGMSILIHDNNGFWINSAGFCRFGK